MSTEESEPRGLVVKPIPMPHLPAVSVGDRGIVIADMDGLSRFSQMVAQSGLAPKGFDTPAKIAVAVQMGMELGLAPLQALQSIAVINGKPGIYGDAALALVRASGLLASFEETLDGEGDARVATCRVRRRDEPKAFQTRFSVADAKRAKLWAKKGRDGQDTPWITYPDRMLQMRARGFRLRDSFPEILRGFKTTQELQDHYFEEEVDDEIVENSEAPANGAGCLQARTAKLAEAAALATKLGWSGEDWFSWLNGEHGVTDASQLSDDQLDAVLGELRHYCGVQEK